MMTMNKIVKTKKTKKIDKKKVEKMSEKFLPEEGYSYYKTINKIKNEIIVSYVIKGSSDILNFIKNRFYDGVSAISQDIKFQVIQIKNNTDQVIVVDDANKYPNIQNDFYVYMSQPPIIKIDKVLDNALEISISFSDDVVDIYDSHLMFVIEYLLKALEDNKILLQEIVEKGKNIFSSDKFIDDILTREEQNKFFNDDVYITNEDKERMKLKNEENEEKN